MLLVKPDLPLRIQTRNKKIQPDLAHSHQLRVITLLHQQLAQRCNIGLICARRKQRVYAQRIAVAMTVRQRNHLLPVTALHSRNHQMTHTRSAGGSAHGIAVGREFGGVQVAVGIYPGRHLRIMHRLLRLRCNAISSESV